MEDGIGGGPACPHMKFLTQLLFPTPSFLSPSSCLLSFFQNVFKKGRTSQFKLESALRRLDSIGFLPILFSGDPLYSDQVASFDWGTSQHSQMIFFLFLFHLAISLTKKENCHGEHVSILIESYLCVHVRTHKRNHELCRGISLIPGIQVQGLSSKFTSPHQGFGGFFLELESHD